MNNAGAMQLPRDIHPGNANAEGRDNLASIIQRTPMRTPFIEALTRHLGVQKAGASHCTGPRPIELFRKTYRRAFVSIGVGKTDIPVDCDFTGDWQVDLVDLVMLIENWGQDDPRFDIAPDFGDGTIDALDLQALMDYWG